MMQVVLMAVTSVFSKAMSYIMVVEGLTYA